MGTGALLPVRELLPAVTAPTLVLHRVDNTLVPTAAVRRLVHDLPAGRLVELPGADLAAFFGDTDARGHGDSAGLPMGLGWFGATDVRAGVDALAARPDVDAVGLVGLSMGGEQALTEAAEDDRVRVVVAEGVGRRTAADTAAIGTGWHASLERTVTAVGMGIADGLSSAHPPAPLRDAVGQVAPRPMLLIAGAGEAEQVGWYRQAAPEAMEVISLPDTAHVGALAADEQWWRATVCGRLDAELTAAHGGGQ